MPYFDLDLISKHLPPIPAHRPLLIAIDGGSGSGKSTLAEELAAHLDHSQWLSLDDFHVPVPDELLDRRNPQDNFEKAFDLHMIESQLLKPLSQGNDSKYQKLYGDPGLTLGWVDIKAQGTVVIEGVYSLRPIWQHYFDFKIWLEMAVLDRRHRMEKRGANSESQMRCWQSTEEWYIRTFNPASLADLALTIEYGQAN